MANIVMGPAPIVQPLGGNVRIGSVVNEYTKAIESLEVGETLTVQCSDEKTAHGERARLDSVATTIAKHGKLCVIRKTGLEVVVRRAL